MGPVRASIPTTVAPSLSHKPQTAKIDRADRQAERQSRQSGRDTKRFRIVYGVRLGKFDGKTKITSHARLLAVPAPRESIAAGGVRDPDDVGHRVGHVTIA